MPLQRVILFLALLLFALCACRPNDVHYEPIGFFLSAYSPATGAPRQGRLMPESKGEIILFPEFTEGLADTDLFEYLWVLYHFNLAEGRELKVRPPQSHQSFGIFASRSPRRPNPIGLTLVKVDSVKDNRLFVSGVDMFTGTPILDIKPYLPSVDFAYSPKNMKAEILLGHHDEDFLNDTLVRYYVKGDTVHSNSRISDHHSEKKLN